ncbi:MAG: carbamoyltransferase N-terminal domain-containing protein, partial [Syntrophales bacterium]
MESNYVLGVWDGHDAGAALLKGEEIVFAINEERLSRRKLEVGFPHRAIRACLGFAGLKPADIKAIAASTTDPAKTLTRIFPNLKEEYYLIRRRKQPPRSFDAFKKTFKYRFTELAPNVISRRLSLSWMHSRLREMGFAGYRLEWVDHHKAHAAAAFCCGFPECMVITLDGVGDGCCGSLWSFRNKKLSLIKSLPASRSLGIFFEHVTNLMNMRELEDEGKVMALANYAYPIADDDNPLMSVIQTKDLDIVTPYSSTAMFREMKKIIWRYPSEQFAAMAQRVLEKCVLDLVAAAL